MLYGLKLHIIDKIRIIFIKYPKIKKVVLYGSRAKGNYRNGSDIDLIFIGDELNTSILNKIEDDLDELLLPYTFDLSILKHIKNNNLLEHIDRVGIIFYELKRR